MIVVEGLSVSYAAEPALREASFTIAEGELALVVGPTGSGKSTLLRSLAGASAPSPPGSTGSGRVLVDGDDVVRLTAQERAGLIGYVRQDPGSGFGDETVEQVLAGAVRARPTDPHAGQRQVEDTLDLLGLADLRARTVSGLSGGQQQRAALGAALVTGPRVLVLDEPTSALDPVAAEELLAVLHRLVHDVGITVVVAEHRLERVVHHADVVLLVDHGEVTGPLPPAEAMARSALRPPVVALGLGLSWRPLPLSVREARRQARTLKASLAADPVVSAPMLAAAAVRSEVVGRQPVVDVRRLSIIRGATVAVRQVSLRLDAGDVLALMGRNGAGKSTLLGAVAGGLHPSSGRVALDGSVALAPQDPLLLLSDDPVPAQLASNDRSFDLPAGWTGAVLARLAPDLVRVLSPGHGPGELSEGQRMSVALALVLARDAEITLLDEPTRGLDYAAKRRLVELVGERSARGAVVIVATHDVELAAELATRAVVLAEGEVVADGPAARILGDSPAFAPQVAKVMRPLPYLRVAEVLAAADAHRAP